MNGIKSLSFQDKISMSMVEIQANFGKENFVGSGFFFQTLNEESQKKSKENKEKHPDNLKYGWVKVDAQYIVTARHVVEDEDGNLAKECVLKFRTRGHGKFERYEEVLSGDDFKKSVFFHPDKRIDVCLIDVNRVLIDLYTKQKINSNWFFSKEDFPSGENKISPEIGSDVMVIGYPNGYHDPQYKSPILKNACIASIFGSYLNGPCFLIDRGLYQGSSGSLVISKPIDLIVENGKILFSKEKKFALLGVYSGKFFDEKLEIDKEELVDFGRVRYYSVIEEILKKSE